MSNKFADEAPFQSPDNQAPPQSTFAQQVSPFPAMMPLGSEEQQSSEESKSQSQQQQRQTSTNQSNNDLSIGNKTAEELVGDILTSDPHDNEIDQMLSRSLLNKNTQNAEQAIKIVASSEPGTDFDSQLMLRHDSKVDSERHLSAT